MTKGELYSLRTGDVVIGKLSGLAYVVTANYGNRVTAVRTVDITNPDEWLLSCKTKKRKPTRVDITGDTWEKVSERALAFIKTVEQAELHADELLARELEVET